MLQDKDFDKLFQDRFKDFEVEPPEGLFDKIKTELDGKRKKSFPVLWMAAASVVLALAIGFWFVKIRPEQVKNQVVRLKPKQKVEKMIQLPKEPAIAQHVNTKTLVDNSIKISANTSLKNNPANLASVNKKQQAEKRVSTKIDSAPDVADNKISEDAIAKTVTTDIQLKTDAISNPEIIVVDKTIQANDQPVLAALSDGETEPARGKQKIRSMGDIINFVVSKVDKRKDKLVQFTDNDEGTSLTGMNLGFVKFKSKTKN